MGSVCEKSTSNSNKKNLIKEKEVERQKNIEVVNLIKAVKSEIPIIENIFSFLEEKTKLNIIVHNKKYQNLFGIDINYYKNKSGKYRIIEKNGICKEYTLKENKLIFEGEFKNGKKNGKAKEFDTHDGQVSFEGTYLNGKRNGKGKEYKYGFLSFEGTYLNGKRNGKGKEYGSYQFSKFEGEFLNGYKIEGKGYDCKDRLLFELERNGIGKEYDYDGNLKFEGEYLNEKKNGKGKCYRNGKLEIEGEYKGDQLNGKVKKYDEKGKLVFEGEYKNGDTWSGKENGKDFQGEYLNGKRWNGKGREYKDVHVGPGCTDFHKILAFEGEYINGKKKGKGEIYDYKSQKYVIKEIDEENDIKNEDEDNYSEDINENDENEKDEIGENSHDEIDKFFLS